MTAVRLSPALGAEVDSWADSQTDAPNRSEAIRRLVEIGQGEEVLIPSPRYPLWGNLY